MIIMNYKCPHCNVEAEIEDRIDFSIDEEFVEVEMLGYCPECERAYSWFELYEYKKSYGFALVY